MIHSSNHSALSVITGQLTLHLNLRQALESVLKGMQGNSSKSIDQLVQEPAVMLILKSIHHCNEQLSNWKRLHERELTLIKAQEKEEAQEAALALKLKAQQEEAQEDEEVGAAMLMVLSSEISKATLKRITGQKKN